MGAVDDAKKYLSLRPPMENKTIFALHPDVLVAGLLDEIERLREDRERLQYALMKVCNSLDDNLPAIITKNIALAALGLPLRGMKEGE